ncbi:MAG: T9SS type A sorting domain-containing protein [Candidatus Micrarchaeota archaeon]|nr:T9SS type A sorting domain-containing protein [Candidatus Micrarchaeota archaeon]
MAKIGKALIIGATAAALAFSPVNKAQAQQNIRQERQIIQELKDKVIAEQPAFQQASQKTYKIGEQGYVAFPKESNVSILDIKDAAKLEIKKGNLSKVTTPIGLRIVYGDGYHYWFTTGGDITDEPYSPGYLDSVGPITSFPSHRNEVNVYPQGKAFIVVPKPYIMPPGAQNHYIKLKIHFLQNVWPPLTDSTTSQIYSYVADFLYARGEPTVAYYFLSYRKQGATKLLVMTCYQCDTAGVPIQHDDPRARGPPVVSIAAAHDQDIVAGGAYADAYLAIGINQDEYWSNGRKYRRVEWWAQGGGVHPRLPIPVYMPRVTKPGVFAFQYYTKVDEDGGAKDFKLSQNYPNPFNARTTIEFSAQRRGFVTLRIYDGIGRVVETLLEGEVAAGDYKLEWDASKHASGVYFYVLNAEGYIERRKMVLLK